MSELHRASFLSLPGMQPAYYCKARRKAHPLAHYFGRRGELKEGGIRPELYEICGGIFQYSMFRMYSMSIGSRRKTVETISHQRLVRSRKDHRMGVSLVQVFIARSK